MNTPWLRPLGDTGLVVSAVGAGGGSLGSMPDNVGCEVGGDEGVATVRRVPRRADHLPRHVERL